LLQALPTPFQTLLRDRFYFQGVRGQGEVSQNPPPDRGNQAGFVRISFQPGEPHGAVRFGLKVIVKAKVAGSSQDLTNFDQRLVPVIGAYFHKRIAFGCGQ
jgi:hypothetical protein